MAINAQVTGPARLLAAAGVLWAVSAGASEPVIRTTHVWRRGGTALAYMAEAGRLDLTGPDGTIPAVRSRTTPSRNPGGPA